MRTQQEILTKQVESKNIVEDWQGFHGINFPGLALLHRRNFERVYTSA